MLAAEVGDDVVVVGLPRGGVPVAAVVADELDAPLDIIVVRKLGVPHQPELGMGAIGEGGVRVLNREILTAAAVTAQELADVETRERAELDRRADAYRAGRPPLPIEGRTVVIVDDGIATGSTARAACEVARANGAQRVVLAVPVAPQDWTSRLADAADAFIAVATPEPFYGVGRFYRDFGQTTDEEVIRLLGTSVGGHRRGASEAVGARREPVAIGVAAHRVEGDLVVPDNATGVVIFAHGSGSSRHSPRNRFVAEVLNDGGLATLLFDLLTPSEEVDRTAVFDIELLGRRLRAATDWVRNDSGLAPLPIGYFGASTGAAAALQAAAASDAGVSSIVSRGGRPDLAGAALADVMAPTLLIVGGLDHVVLDLNRQAQARLRCPSRLEVVPGATHLFEEPGTLVAAAETARDWFQQTLTA